MKFRDMLKSLIITSGSTMASVARQMGWSPQLFNDKLLKGTLRYLDAEIIANDIGYEIKWHRRSDTLQVHGDIPGSIDLPGSLLLSFTYFKSDTHNSTVTYYGCDSISISGPSFPLSVYGEVIVYSNDNLSIYSEGNCILQLKFD